MAFSNTPGFGTWVFFQAIIPYSVVHNGSQLIIDRFQISFGIGFSVSIMVRYQFILPFPDVCRCDLRYWEFTKERQQLLFNDVLLMLVGVFPDSVLDVLVVNLYEALKCHSQICLLRFQKIPFPILWLLFAA